MFLEHVFWVISLNTLFTVIFGKFEVDIKIIILSAYFPYRLGYFALSHVGVQQQIYYFPSVAAIITGYFIISFFIYGIHAICGFFKWKT